MSHLARVLLLGAIAVIAFDTLASLASRRFGFRYTAAVVGSFLIYGAVGYFAVRAADGGVALGALAGAAMGLVDATVGWAISSAIGPGRPPITLTVARWVTTAVGVAATGAVFGALGGLVAPRGAPPSARLERAGARAEADARAAVGRWYAEHFAAGQGFSVETLRARRAWFTPRLYGLMLADMSAEGGIGTIEADPFTAAQDDAARYAVGEARRAGDTVLVDVEVSFDSTVGGGAERRRVTVAALPGAAGWQIADLRAPEGSLAAALLGASAADSAPARR